MLQYIFSIETIIEIKRFHRNIDLRWNKYIYFVQREYKNQFKKYTLIRFIYVKQGFTISGSNECYLRSYYIYIYINALIICTMSRFCYYGTSQCRLRKSTMRTPELHNVDSGTLQCGLRNSKMRTPKLYNVDSETPPCGPQNSITRTPELHNVDSETLQCGLL